MERQAGRIADYLVKHGVVESADRDFYRYSVECLLLYAINYCTLFVIAMVLGKIPQCILFIATFSFLRSSSGGWHMKKWYTCYMASCSIITIALILPDYISIRWFVLLPVLIAIEVGNWMWAPCVHPNHPISENHFVRSRRKAIIRYAIAAGVVISFKCLRMDEVAVLCLEAGTICTLLLVAGTYENNTNRSLLEFESPERR